MSVFNADYAAFLVGDVHSMRRTSCRSERKTVWLMTPTMMMMVSTSPAEPQVGQPVGYTAWLYGK